MLMTSDIPTMLRLHRAMFLAREIDRVEQAFVKQGIAHFHVSGAGHESTALVADYLGAHDWLHLHYRDKALLLARGLPIEEFFRGLLATGPSHSAGRQMSAHFSARELKVASMVGPVGNNALHAVGNAQAVKDAPEAPVVLCCVGDGTTQQGEFLEAVAEAVRYGAPVLFLIQNNRWSISTQTPGQTFFDLPGGPASSFMGLDIVRFDGVDLQATRAAFEGAVGHIREARKPALLVMDVERLSNHTNADDQTGYRSSEDIAAAKKRDPLESIRQALRESQMGDVALTQLETALIAEVAAAAAEVRAEAGPTTAGTAKAPYPAEFATRREYRGDGTPALTMREAMNAVLRAHLEADPRVTLLGQDIEDPKGDVFGVTRGLSSAFPGRVRNAALSESTIVGTSIGRALAGERPVGFLQFADFLPLAFNQIVSELGSMYWRTNGAWQAPVILMVSCGGYKAGLGPFHAQTLESILAHTPGIDVVMPSSAADAAGLLNAAFTSDRPTVFLYPKIALNLSDRKTSEDTDRQFVLPGRARLVEQGDALTLVTYGNPLVQCQMAAKTLADAGFAADLVDLRSISPWDEAAVLRSVRRTGKLLVVHEDNISAGFGAEVAATMAERAGVPITVRRLARDDTYVPFHFETQIATLPSYRSILTAAAEMLDLELTWEQQIEQSGPVPVAAIGSGPADDEVEIVEISVKPGDRIKSGDLLAVVEATKAAVDIESTVAGTVASVVVELHQKVPVGAPLLFVDPDPASLISARAVTAERIDKAHLKRRASAMAAPQVRTEHSVVVGVSGIAATTGSRKITNGDLRGNWQTRDNDDIVRLTGIESRRWVAPGETVLTLAASAAGKLLDEQELGITDIDLVIAATGTPDIVTPSLACRVADSLARSGKARIPSYDINAACSGYLYALAQARDFVSNNPRARVMVVTSEVLSPLLDQNDFNTAVLFADAATASLVTGIDVDPTPLFTFARPTISGAPESGELLRVPMPGSGYIKMNGREVFSDAVRSMTQTLISACAAEGIDMDDIDLMVPHQANQRIIDAIARRSNRPAHSVIRHLGNTSSSTIPLALMDALPQRKVGERLGLVAFGGGITYAAAVATVVREPASANPQP